MKKRKKLSQLNPNEDGTVISLGSDGSIRRRLQDMGIIEGTKIKCLFASPFNDPVAYEVRGAVIALRCDDSKNIFVK